MRKLERGSFKVGTGRGERNYHNKGRLTEGGKAIKVGGECRES